MFAPGSVGGMRAKFLNWQWISCNLHWQVEFSRGYSAKLKSKQSIVLDARLQSMLTKVAYGKSPKGYRLSPPSHFCGTESPRKNWQHYRCSSTRRNRRNSSPRCHSLISGQYRVWCRCTWSSQRDTTDLLARSSRSGPVLSEWKNRVLNRN